MSRRTPALRPANDIDPASSGPVDADVTVPPSGHRELLHLSPSEERLAAELLEAFMVKVLGAIR